MDGSFNYEGNKGEAIHVNIPDDRFDACKGVQCVMLEARTSKNGQKFAGGRVDLYAEKWVEPVKSDMFLKSSELKLDGKPVVSDTSATINKQQKTGKKLSFKFKPVEFNGATYTVTENIVAYNGDHYMRKYLEISVPEEDKLDAEIDYIDLESLNVTNSKGQWTIPTDQGSIVGTPMERAIIGQPFYADGMFFGCEFPAADTQIIASRMGTRRSVVRATTPARRWTALPRISRQAAPRTVAFIMRRGPRLWDRQPLKIIELSKRTSSITSMTSPHRRSSVFSTTPGTTTRRTSATRPFYDFAEIDREMSSTSARSIRMSLTMVGPTTLPTPVSGSSIASSPTDLHLPPNWFRTSVRTSVHGSALAAAMAPRGRLPTPCRRRTSA